MNDQQELLKLLEITSQRVQHHHNTLWEEEKHYSWWIYIIFAGLIYLYLKLPGITFLEPCQQALLMGIGNAFGLFMSITGYHVVRRESEFFYGALRTRKRILGALGVKQSIIREFVPARDKANEPLLRLFSKAFGSLFHASVIRNSTKRNSQDSFGIRDGFQLTFIITAILFIGFGIFSVVTLAQSA